MSLPRLEISREIAARVVPTVSTIAYSIALRDSRGYILFVEFGTAFASSPACASSLSSNPTLSARIDRCSLSSSLPLFLWKLAFEWHTISPSKLGCKLSQTSGETRGWSAFRRKDAQWSRRDCSTQPSTWDSHNPVWFGDALNNIEENTDQCNREIKYDVELTLYSEANQQHSAIKRAEVLFHSVAPSGM